LTCGRGAVAAAAAEWRNEWMRVARVAMLSGRFHFVAERGAPGAVLRGAVGGGGLVGL
jgi:hypothetical protein